MTAEFGSGSLLRLASGCRRPGALAVAVSHLLAASPLFALFALPAACSDGKEDSGSDAGRDGPAAEQDSGTSAGSGDAGLGVDAGRDGGADLDGQPGADAEEEETPPATAAVLATGFAGDDPDLRAALMEDLTAVGYTLTPLDADGACDVARLNEERMDLLVLPDGSELPACATSVVQKFLEAGGHLLALRAPLFQRPFVKTADAGWQSFDDYWRDRATKLPAHVLFGFGENALSSWRRSFNPAGSVATYETVAEGPAQGMRAFHAVVDDLSNWDMLGTSVPSDAFLEGQTVTAFAAKGDSNTESLLVEWSEQDGSRWIAVVPLTSEWRGYALAPEAFRFWQSVPGRGGPGDRFNPTNASFISIGLAFSHGSTPGRHEYWVGPLGTETLAPEAASLAFSPPVLETLSPSYKFFATQDAARIATPEGQAVIARYDGASSASLRAMHPRAQGAGFDKGRTWRWTPLLEARAADGGWRGSVAGLLLQANHTHPDGDGVVNRTYAPGAWATFTLEGAETYKTSEIRRVMRDLARSMKRGVFLLDGGSNFFTYFEGQTLGLGVRVVNAGHAPSKDFLVRVVVADPTTDEDVYVREWPLELAAGEVKRVSGDWSPTDRGWPDTGFSVRAELLFGGRVVDRLLHEAHVWRPKTTKDFVTVEDGHFMLRGTRWRASGVNYWPSSGMATEDWNYFIRPWGAEAYDPEAVERDLAHLEAAGLNALSIQMRQEDAASQGLLDALRRMDRHGFKTNVYVGNFDPYHFEWDFAILRSLLETLRLLENDTIFAYDLAWEPSFGSHDARTAWDADWRAFIDDRYGSLANAERDWGVGAPRDGSSAVTNPFPQDLVDGTPGWKMVAAYRRFLDTLLYKKYQAARATVRSIDPNHLVSFRMAEAGNPTYHWTESIPYDFPYLAGAVDFLAPEGYGRQRDVKPGRFERDYARWAAPHLPMIWAEAGMSVWNSSLALDRQATFFRDFYTMLIDSDADGVFFWWSPGGFRFYENSDYGILNPDGTDRPVTRVIREMSAAFLGSRNRPPPNLSLFIDRDAHPSGVGGVYDEVQETYWNAIEQRGLVPELRTAGTRTTSANCPLTAVGNTEGDPSLPPKFLDGVFDDVEVERQDGTWVSVETGATLSVGAGSRPIRARVRLTNLGEATWLSPHGTAGAGAVSLDGAVGRVPISAPIPADVPRFGSITLHDIVLAEAGVTEGTSVDLRLIAAHRATFGERFRLVLRP